jgi:DNA modification methylase
MECRNVFLYYANFIPGLQEIVAETVRERLHDAVLHRLLDGAILFETSIAYDKLNFFCFNNIFAAADVMEHASPIGADAPSRALEAHIGAIIQNGLSPAAEQVIAHNSAKFRTFRIVISRENTPAAIDEKLRLEAERYIARISGLKADRAKPDAEFWLLYRHDYQPPERQFSVFMKRLTLRPSWEKSLHPGELPPPLAWTLCRLGNLKADDTVLDPFCGYGSIPHAALKYFHITRCIACDSNEKAAAYTANKAAGRKKNHPAHFVLHKADFRSLASVLPAHSVDAVITDPPWGHYQDVSIAKLYKDMFRVFDLLLKVDGRMVILGDRTDALTNAAQNSFMLHQKIPILLSGKKAAVYSFKAVPRS